MMEYKKKSPFINISFTTINNTFDRTVMDYHFILVLNGTLRVHNNTHTFFMESNDLYLLSADHSYSISSAGNNIILSIIMDRTFFSKGRSLNDGYYICNSVLDQSRDYKPLRQLLSQIATIYFDEKPIQELNLMSLAYNLVYYLSSYHYIEDKSKKSLPASQKHDKRLNEILSYIHQNSESNISLQKTAHLFHLSIPYFSSYFKKNMNENFNSYVNHIRLEKAVEDLIYSTKTITSISYDHGFSSLNAFNKIFKESYHTTPKKYRDAKKKERQVQESSPSEITIPQNTPEHDALLNQLTTDESFLLSDIQFPSQVDIYIENIQNSKMIKPIWNTLINVGKLSQLSKRDIERQLNLLQEGIGFKYARIENVLDVEEVLDYINNPKILFTTFDRVIDLLTMNQLLPYLDLSYSQEYLSSGNEKIIDIDTEKYINTIKEILMHSANYYGPDIIKNWYFEINYFEHLFEDKYESIESFVRRFCSVYRLIKNLLPDANVGGICHDALFDYSRFEAILAELKKEEINPDFLSIGIIPYEYMLKNTDAYSVDTLYYSNNKSFALDKVLEFKELISTYFSHKPHIHVAYLTPDIFNHSFINDTCFQSTFFFHNTIELLGHVDMLGYYQLSDNSSTPEDSNEFLDGRSGIFNQFGIKKPGCHLLEIFTRAHPNLVQKGSDYIVLKGNQRRYMIGLCNYTYISDYHCMTISHENTSITNAYSIYENPQTKYVSIHLKNLIPGTYDIILHQINKNHGSVLDEWARNGFWNRFSREELEYMRKTLQPLKTHQEKLCADGTMDFEIQVASHEVIFITLFYRW